MALKWNWKWVEIKSSMYCYSPTHSKTGDDVSFFNWTTGIEGGKFGASASLVVAVSQKIRQKVMSNDASEVICLVPSILQTIIYSCEIGNGW